MDTTIIGRRATSALAVALLAGAAAVGLAGCQTPTDAGQPAPQTIPAPPALGERYAGLPADRIVDRLGRDIRQGVLPEPGCILNVVVEHPDGGFHLVCTAHRGE